MDGYRELTLTVLLTDTEMEQLQKTTDLRNESGHYTNPWTVEDSAKCALRIGNAICYMDEVTAKGRRTK